MRNDPRSVKARELMTSLNWKSKELSLILPYAVLYYLGFKTEDWLVANFNDKTVKMIKENRPK